MNQWKKNKMPKRDPRSYGNVLIIFISCQEGKGGLLISGGQKSGGKQL